MINQVGASVSGALSANAATITNTYALCDVNLAGSTNAVDIQSIVNQALGIVAAANDLNADGALNVVDVQIAMNSALGRGCVATSMPLPNGP